MLLICNKCKIGLPPDETECPMCKLVTALEKILSHAEAGSKGVSLMYALIKMEAEQALAKHKESEGKP